MDSDDSGPDDAELEGDDSDFEVEVRTFLSMRLLTFWIRKHAKKK